MTYKKLYVTTKETWASQAKHLNGSPMVRHRIKPPKAVRNPVTGLWTMADPEYDAVPVPHTELFNPATGSHFIDLPDGTILLATCLEHSEANQEIWHAHPEVARLPHPIFEGNMPIRKLIDDTVQLPKKFRQKHMNALKNASRLEFNENDSVIEVSRKAKKIKADVCIGF